jgi:hypothetical protein
MPQLIKNIQGEVLTNVITDVKFVSNVTGEVQREDHINLNGFVGFLQNLTKTEETNALTIPNPFGLQNKHNKKIVTLEISY